MGFNFLTLLQQVLKTSELFLQASLILIDFIETANLLGTPLSWLQFFPTLKATWSQKKSTQPFPKVDRRSDRYDVFNVRKRKGFFAAYLFLYTKKLSEENSQ